MRLVSLLLILEHVLGLQVYMYANRENIKQRTKNNGGIRMTRAHPQ